MFSMLLWALDRSTIRNQANRPIRRRWGRWLDGHHRKFQERCAGRINLVVWRFTAFRRRPFKRQASKITVLLCRVWKHRLMRKSRVRFQYCTNTWRIGSLMEKLGRSPAQRGYASNRYYVGIWAEPDEIIKLNWVRAAERFRKLGTTINVCPH